MRGRFEQCVPWTSSKKNLFFYFSYVKSSLARLTPPAIRYTHMCVTIITCINDVRCSMINFFATLKKRTFFIYIINLYDCFALAKSKKKRETDELHIMKCPCEREHTGYHLIHIIVTYTKLFTRDHVDRLICRE